MTSEITPGHDLSDRSAESYVNKARVAETLQAYGFGCDRKHRQGLLAVFTEDARAMYDGENWLEGGTTIVDWLLAALGGLSYSQHMITAPRVTVDGESAAAVAYMNSHQCAEADPGTLIRMNGHYDCDLRLVDGDWRISRLVLTAGWFVSEPSSHRR